MIAPYNVPESNAQSGSNEDKREEKDLSVPNVSRESNINLEELRNRAVNFIPKGALIHDEKYSLPMFAEETLSQISKFYPIVEALFYMREKGSEEFLPIGDYAYFSEKKPSGFKLGETLPGQVAKNMKPMSISDIPENYIIVTSGLGKAKPRHLYFLPLIVNEKTIAVIEMASFKEFDKESETLFEFVAIELSKALAKLDTKNL